MNITSSLHSSISSCYTLLLILTSTIFAVSQYYDSRQRELIKKDQEYARRQPLTEAARPEFERIVNDVPINNQKIIKALWVLLFFYVTMLMLILIDPYWPDNYRIPLSPYYHDIVSFSSIYLFGVSICLSFKLRAMSIQRNKFRLDFEMFKRLCEAVSSSTEND